MFEKIPVASAFVATLLVSTASSATPRAHPFTYPYETLAEGESELEQYADFTPVRVTPTNGNAARAWYGSTEFQTEFEYGLRDRLELGLYVTYVPAPSAAFANVPEMLEGNGIKQRLRLRLFDEGTLPVDVGLYVETVEDDHEFELESKIIVAKRVGPVRVAANAVVEREWYYSGAKSWVLVPSAAASVEVTPTFQPGIEGWVRAEYPDPAPAHRTFELGPQAYVGPTFLFSFGRFWWSSGIYSRATDIHHTMDIGDSYGKIWARTIVGLQLLRRQLLRNPIR